MHSRMNEQICNWYTWLMDIDGCMVHWIIIRLTHTNVWESMGRPCSCTQFIKSRIFYYKSHDNPCQYCKSCENLYQVLQVTRESVSGTTSHVRCIWTCNEIEGSYDNYILLSKIYTRECTCTYIKYFWCMLHYFLSGTKWAIYPFTRNNVVISHLLYSDSLINESSTKEVPAPDTISVKWLPPWEGHTYYQEL